MEGSHQGDVGGGWMERRSTVSLALSDTAAWRWQHIAREQNIGDHSSLAVFLVKYYEDTRGHQRQASCCSACGSPLAQFCSACFSLTPTLQLQDCDLHTTVQASYNWQYGSGQQGTPLCSTSDKEADAGSKVEDTQSTRTNLKEENPVEDDAAEDDDDTNDDADFDEDSNVDADYGDDTDEEYYTRESSSCVQTQGSIKSQNDLSEEAKHMCKTENATGKSTLGKNIVGIGKDTPREEKAPAAAEQSHQFTCHVCLQIFFDPDQLVMHMQTHSDHMVHECTQCKARFFKPEVLAMHMHIHSKVKKHPCVLCTASYSKTYSLAKHKLIKHKQGSRIQKNTNLTNLNPRHVDTEQQLKQRTNVADADTFSHVQGGPLGIQTTLVLGQIGYPQDSPTGNPLKASPPGNPKNTSPTENLQKTSLVGYPQKDSQAGNSQPVVTDGKTLGENPQPVMTDNNGSAWNPQKDSLTGNPQPVMTDNNGSAWNPQKDSLTGNPQPVMTDNNSSAWNPQKDSLTGNPQPVMTDNNDPAWNPQKDSLTGNPQPALPADSGGAVTAVVGSSLTCAQCGKQFVQRHHLDRHALVHTGEKRYACQQCGSAFAQLSSLVVHMHSHTRHKPFQCGVCHKTFTTLSYMTRHVCRSAATKNMQRNSSAKTSTQLVRHSRRHLARATHSSDSATESRPQACEGVTTKGLRSALDSAIPHRPQGSAQGRRTRLAAQKVMVGMTMKKSRNESKRRNYSKEINNDQTPPSSAVSQLCGAVEGKPGEQTHPHCCQFCGAQFMFLTHLTRHLQDHTGENAFKCSQCQVSCRSPARLEIHMRCHSSRDFPCQYCGKVLKSGYTLKEHLRSHTGERPFKCEVCGSCFTLSSTYKAHLRTHSGDRPYLCAHCGKSFVRSSNLSVHIRACTGDKPYTCSVCGKSFSDVGYFKKHVNNHAGIKPYKCEYCGKAFTQSTSLKLHIRVHTGEKPYKCTQCSMAFAIPNSLTEHMRKHTGDKPYKCSICGKGFAKSCNRLAHFRTHSKGRLV